MRINYHLDASCEIMIDGKGPDVSQIDVMTLNNFMVVLILHYIIQIIFRIIFFRATPTLVRCRTKRSSFITPWLSENRKLIKIAWIRVKWFRSQKVNYCFERDTIDACVNIALMFSRMFFYPIHSFRERTHANFPSNSSSNQRSW